MDDKDDFVCDTHLEPFEHEVRTISFSANAKSLDEFMEIIRYHFPWEDYFYFFDDCKSYVEGMGLEFE